MTQLSAKAVQSAEELSSGFGLQRWVGLFLGPALFVLMFLIPVPEGMTPEAVRVAAMTLWIAVWWVTEPIPIPATSLLPIVLLPLTNTSSVADATSGYSNPLIFVFIGGFMIALALERWGLHRRIALFIVSLVGSSPTRMVLGFMAATGFLSMWISNTATAMMMLPIGIAVIVQMSRLMLEQDSSEKTQKILDNFGAAMMLGIAYAASIGGMATLIGTPPNVVLAGAAEELLGVNITFAQWMIVGVPLATVGLLGVWLYMTRIALPVPTTPIDGAMKVIKQDLRELGSISRAEWSVLIIFLLTAFAWISQEWVIKPFFPKVDDSVIAVTGAILLFTVPLSIEKNKFILDWDTAKGLPWGVVLLFGGGLSIAAAFKSSGLSEWLGTALSGLNGLPTFVVVLTLVAMITFLTELTSNTATATMMMPVMAALGVALGIDPLLMMIPVALAASCAFMMPVATPPNAIVFGSGKVSIQQMIKVGWWVNLGSIALLTLVCYFIIPLIWGNGL
ncbi:MAG: DASS family sodium-coupled anion symporter [Chloroflexaceae bacterium]|nr:DASS family sodium-coupled anion symporter [Chloroflexaceae bacterium]